MTTIVPVLKSAASSNDASDWLCQIIATIGPCFHYDTPPGDYLHSDGKPLFSKIECRRLAQGLDRAFEVLGRDVFEGDCLRVVWKQLGVQYDAKLEQLLPIESGAMQYSKA